LVMAEAAGEARAAGEGPQSPKIQTRARILIADDDPSVLQVLETVLSGDGYEVVKAEDGETALELARRDGFDLSMLDVQLLKRVSYITGGVAASLAALSVLGCNVDQPRALATGAASQAPTANPPSPQPNVPFATPPAAATTNPVTVQPNDPRLRAANAVGIPSGDGKATLIGYEAYPAT